ncbi:MAG TPA: hypothetical protein VNX17_05885 [Edaphobacter sp.]|nr:hypothetical protein [Edaphobacter sp.]
MKLLAASVEMTIRRLRETGTDERRQKLVCGLGAERGVGDGGSAVIAEDGSWVDGLAACVAVGGECAGGGSEDVAGDVEGLGGVVLADAAWHEEGFDPGDDHGDARPREDEVEEAEAIAAEVEVMDAEAAEEDGEKDADDFVLAGAFLFGVEPGSLMVVHVGGVGGIDWVHGFVPLGWIYEERGVRVPVRGE